MGKSPHNDLVAGLTTLRDIVQATPSAVLEFYEFGIILRKPREDGNAAYAVDPEHVHAALSATASIDTGLLLGDTLMLRRDGQKSITLEYRAPQITGIWLEGSENAYRIPLPPLVLVRTLQNKTASYQLFAVKRRPDQLNEHLYQAPLPHVGHESGSICWGTVPKPNPKTMHTTNSLAEDWKLLLGSKFGNHTVSGLSKKYAKDVRQMYAAFEAEKVETYPLDDLIDSKLTFGGLVQRLRR